MSRRLPHALPCLAAALALYAGAGAAGRGSDPPPVDVTTLHGKVMCGYQGWFRCPGDAADMGWVHWSREGKRIAPGTLTFEMWPDLREFPPVERYPAPGFTYPDGRAAELFSSDCAATVLRHFQWMRDYGIDGAWLQRFVVGLPGGIAESSYPSTLRVLHHVADAAAKTGRAWALSYDTAATPTDRTYDALTADWKRLVDGKLTDHPRYLHQGGLPVVQIWGFYWRNEHDPMTADLAARLIDFFKTPGPYRAFLVGGGDWNWRRNPDPAWAAIYRRFDAYCPWNVGNYGIDAQGERHAALNTWADDQRECDHHAMFWIPVVYPGFGWDNLMRKPPGSTQIPRRGGRFLWVQLHAAARMHAGGVYVAMFDEVDEGTAIFKVTSTPPKEAHFVGYEGLPSDWYLRLVGEGARMLRGERPLTELMPLAAGR